MLRLAEKAFWPARIPFPVMHVDTGHNFPEVHRVPRPTRSSELGARLVVASVQESIDEGRVVEETGPRASRNRLQTTTLLDAIEEHRFDAVFGGARRDEEKARAKERVYSLPRRVRPVGPEEPAARAVEPLQRPPPPGRAHPGVPAVELDRARHLAVHRARRTSSCRRSTTPTSARCSGATACCWRSTPFITLMRRRGAVRGAPCATAPSATRPAPARSSPTADTVDEVIAEVAATRHHRARRHPRPTTGSSEAAMEDRKTRGVLLMELLRFATAGSVDDGKTTLIGRLLYDSKAIFEDQLEAVERTSAATAATSYTNLALLTDGLRAEREQGITIDVAYRYFATPEAQVHHRRHPGPHPVHAQHGHRRVDRRPRARPGRRPQGRASSSPAATRSSPRCCGSRTSCCASTRWTSSTTTRTSSSASRTSSARSPPSSTSPTSPSSRSRRCTATTSSTARPNMPWYEGPSLLHHLEERAHRVRPQPDRRPLPGAVRDPADERRAPRLPRLRRARSPAACSSPATRSWCCRRASPRRIAVDRHRRRPGRRGVPADVGDHHASPTTSTSAAAT